MPHLARSAALARGAALAGLAALLAGCAGQAEPDRPTITATSESGSAAPTGTTAGTPPASDSPSLPAERPRQPTVVATVAADLAVPWGIAFLPDGSAVVTERDSTRVLHLVPTSEGYDVREVGRLTEATPQGESGLLGVAASPSYATDGLLYFYLSTPEDNRIARARFDGATLGPLEVLLDGIPHGFIHDGGRLVFGPDGYLYASTGETGQRELAQDLDSLGGKILRLTADGRPAPGNPDADSPVWSWGHRNVQGLAFDDDGRLWASEFGDSTWDELNLIRRGQNYGWPIVEGRGDVAGLTDPEVVWRTDEASPSGLAWLDGDLWLGALRGERLWRIPVEGDRAGRPEAFFVGELGRVRTVTVAPDGRLWITTSNRDGRGVPATHDDRILVVDPGRG